MQAGNLLLLIVLMGVFYFMLIRPQRKRLTEHNQLLSTLAPGDEVLTIGGLYGFVNRIEDDMVWLEITEGFEVRFSKTAISRKVSAGESAEQVEVEDTEPEPEAEAPIDQAEADPTT